MKDTVIEAENLKEPKIYELGYLLSPLVPEASKDAEVATLILSHIEAKGGEVLSQTAPVLKKLAYKISKTINHKKTSVADAYFGAVKFTVTPDKVEAIKQAVDKQDTIVRTLLIETSLQADVPIPKEVVAAVAEEGVVEDKEVPNNETIDKEIEELLVA